MEPTDPTAMEVDMPSKKDAKSKSSPPETRKVTWVAAPSSPEDLGSHWTEENSTAKRLLQFIARWPPSRTPASYGPWITIYRGGLKDSKPNFDGLTADFEALVAKGDPIKHDHLDKIATANNVLFGKWMVFAEPNKVDMLWGKVAHFLCMDRKRGVAKVSTYKENERHVIEVFVDDYTDQEEVTALRKKLRGLGVKWKCKFKPDAYSHLKIYKDNPWNIKPSRYVE